jgi:hypothetical protein
MICVREDHTARERQSTQSSALTLAAMTKAEPCLSQGITFIPTRDSTPMARLAWLTWNHPNMPWDGCELWVGDVSEVGTLGKSERVAGGLEESIFQPEWAPDGVLYFVSDRTGWWNLYRRRDGVIDPVCEMEAEFGVPLWVFGLTTYAFESANRIICTYIQRGPHLAMLDTSTRQLTNIETPFASHSNPRLNRSRRVHGGITNRTFVHRPV